MPDVARELRAAVAMSRLALLLLVAFAAVIGSTLMATQAADVATTKDEASATISGVELQRMGGFGMGFGGPARVHGFGGFGAIEVSAEFEQTAKGIANNDTDVQNLIAEGYNVTAVRPLIKNVVDAEGYVTTRANSAVLLLEKDTSGYASVNVDLEEGKVTQIVIMTRTVIDKT